MTPEEQRVLLEEMAHRKLAERMAAVAPPEPPKTHDEETGLLLPEFQAEAEAIEHEHVPRTYADRYVRCSVCNVVLATPEPEITE